MKKSLQRAPLALMAGWLLIPAIARGSESVPAGEIGPSMTTAGAKVGSPTGNSFVGRDNWREEFDRICVHTNVATSLSGEQLNQLIEDSNRLLDILDTLDHPHKKVFILRLRNCREFFKFALEVQKADSPDGSDGH
jgi:hypothetical protein